MLTGSLSQQLCSVINFPPLEKGGFGDDVPPGGAHQGAGAEDGGNGQTREHDLQQLRG